MSKTKNDFFNQRNDISNQILNILHITDTNKIISLKYLDENTEIQNQILALESNIKKYFICSRWTYFNCKNRKCKRSYLSLIKAIMKAVNIKIITSIQKNDISQKFETNYIFNI